MADVTADRTLYWATGHFKPIVTPVKASAEIYRGTMVIITAGYALDGSNDASSVFGGVALNRQTGGASDGDTTVPLLKKGRYWFVLDSGAATDLGKECYLLFNATVAVAAPGTGDIKVGRIQALALNADGTGAGTAYALVQIDNYC